MKMTFEELKQLKWDPKSAMSKVTQSDERNAILLKAKQYCDHNSEPSGITEETHFRNMAEHYAEAPEQDRQNYVFEYRKARELQDGIVSSLKDKRIVLTMGGEETTDSRSLSGNKVTGFLKGLINKGTASTDEIVTAGSGGTRTGRNRDGSE